MSTKALSTSPTARKVVGSLAVVGAAAAVAGMGTFGSFTDSTTPVDTTISSGTIDINLAAVGEAIPVTTAGFVPGDSLTRAVNVSNIGSAPFGSVVLSTTVATASVLTTDITNGLQLAVKSCSVPWTQGGAPGAPTYTCSGTTSTLASGPAVGNTTLSNPASLAAGKTDHLTFTVSLPTSADNSFQGQTAALSLKFTGSQQAGTAR